MSSVGTNHIKEESDWDDYCISEARAREEARGGRGLEREPPDTNYQKTDDSIDSQLNSIKSRDTEQNNNDSVTVKEESEDKSWLQALTSLYEESNNTDELKKPLDLYSRTTEKLKTDASEEPKTESPVFQKPMDVNSRRDLMVINNIAGEVNRKRALQPVVDRENVSRPVIRKHVQTPTQQPVASAKPNSLSKKPNVCNKVTINPEIGFMSQPLKVANSLLKNNLVSVSDSVKNQSSNLASLACNQTIPLLNSVANNNPAMSTQLTMVPTPYSPRRTTESLTQPLPTGICRRIRAPISRPLHKGVCRTAPNAQLNGKVSLKPLQNPPSITTTGIPNFRLVTISKSQPGSKPKLRRVIISRLRPGTIPKLQSGSISKLQPGTITKLQSGSISNLQAGTITKLQPGTITKLQSGSISNLPAGTITKLQSGSISKLQPGTITKLQSGSVSNLRAGTISTLQPGAINKMQPNTISKLQPYSIPKLLPGTISTLQPGTIPNLQFGSISNLQAGIISTLQPGAIYKLQPGTTTKLQLDTTTKIQSGSISNLQAGTISTLQPGTISKLQPVTISKLQPDTTPKLQSGSISNLQLNTITKLQTSLISKLQPGAISKLLPSTISKLQPNSISKWQPGTITKSQPGTIPKFQSGCISKLNPGTVPKLQPDTALTLRTNALNLQSGPHNLVTATMPTSQSSRVPSLLLERVPKLERFTSPSRFNETIISNRYDSVKSIYQKTSTSGTLNSNMTTTPTSKRTPMVPTSFQRITPKPILKPIDSQIRETVESNLISKIINSDGQPKEAQNNPNIQRKATLAPQPIPKPVNSQIARPTHNHIPQNENGHPKAEVTQNGNVQGMEPKTVPKVSGPVNSLISKSIHSDIIPGCINDDRHAVTRKLPPNSNTASETSDKIVNLEDFLKPSYVVLERMKERTCKDCEKTFYEHKAFIDHVKTRQKWKTPVSNLGNDGGTRKDTKNIDSSLPSLTCEYCQKLFSRHILLSQHVRRNHHCRIRKFHCDYCGKKCLERRHLVDHIRTHTGEKPYKCLICKTRYRTASNLASHNINMHRAKKHFCPICNRSFHASSNLKKHIRSHSGERRHVCEICNKRFIEKHHLKHHMESHSGVRQYACKTCKMQFTLKSHLVSHEKKNIHNKKMRLRKNSRITTKGLIKLKSED